MPRRLAALVALLTVWGCSPGSESAAPTVHTIDAPRREVFAELARPVNFPAFSRIGNNTARQRYELTIDDDLLLSFDRKEDAQPILEQFRGGEIEMIAERPDRFVVALKPPSGGRALRYFLNLADGESAAQTVVSLQVDESDGALSGEQKAQMDQFVRLMSGRMGPRLVRRLEEKMESAETLNTMDEVDAAARRQVLRETVEGFRETVEGY